MNFENKTATNFPIDIFYKGDDFKQILERILSYFFSKETFRGNRIDIDCHILTEPILFVKRNNSALDIPLTANDRRMPNVPLFDINPSEIHWEKGILSDDKFLIQQGNTRHHEIYLTLRSYYQPLTLVASFFSNFFRNENGIAHSKNLSSTFAFSLNLIFDPKVNLVVDHEFSFVAENELREYCEGSDATIINYEDEVCTVSGEGNFTKSIR